MASVKINKNTVMQRINLFLGREHLPLRPIAREMATVNFNVIKKKTLTKFDNHKVSAEIRKGPQAGADVLPFGNLFSFLGFDSGAEPVENLRTFLEESIRLNPIPSYNGKLQTYYFSVNIPRREDVEDATDSELKRWAKGQSWAYLVEEGVSNLNNYLFLRSQTLPNSASGPALQKKYEIRGGEFGGTPYITEILNYLENLVALE